MSELDEMLGGTATLDIVIYEPDKYLADEDEISNEFDDLFDEDILKMIIVVIGLLVEYI